MTEILITGGSGFVGQAVAHSLPAARPISSADLDFTDGPAVMAAVADWRPDIVIHLAARVGGISANLSRPADFLLDNLRIDGNLLAALKRYPPQHVIVMLSTCMYPEAVAPELYPMGEDLIEAGPPPPTNASYAAAKRALWHGTRALFDQYRVSYTALVAANLYGPRDHFGDPSSHFLAAAIHKIEAARRLDAPGVQFFGTGRALRQYVFVEDLGELIAHLSSGRPLNETVNVAPAESRSIKELAELVARAAAYSGSVVFTGRGPDGQFRKDVDPSRLQELVPPWKAMETPLEDGVAKTLDWYRAHVATS